MDARQIQLTQETWEAVEPIAGQAAILFYDKLFSIDPELRRLFPEDMADQRVKLMKMIGVAVRGLGMLDAIVPAVQDLGRRHVDYKVAARDYDAVGQALLWTLGQGLGAAFTDEVKEAWTAAYTLLADTMKAAAKEKEAVAKEKEAVAP